jgi:hypothetical protein
MTEPLALVFRSDDVIPVMAKAEVVACEVVAWSAVTFCSDVEPVSKRLESVAKAPEKFWKVAPPVALSCPAIVVDPVMVSAVPVALRKSVAPLSVVEPRRLAKVELRAPATVVEPVTARFEVVPEVREKLRPEMRPVFDIEKRVEVEKAVVVEAMTKSWVVVVESVLVGEAKMER